LFVQPNLMWVCVLDAKTHVPFRSYNIPMTTAIIWDVDGTLLDTAEHHFRAWEQWAGEAGFPFTRADFAATFGMRNPEVIRKLFLPKATDAEARRIAFDKEELYRQAVRRDGTELLPGVRKLLEQFHTSGLKQAIGSSAPRMNLELLLDVTGIRGFFATVVSGDDVNIGKPNPEVFLTAAARMNTIPAHCLVIEDAVVGVLAAKAAGMRCLAVTCAGHHSAEALRQAGADEVVGNLGEPGWFLPG
jgi:beta-phosphoglucomutase